MEKKCDFIQGVTPKNSSDMLVTLIASVVEEPQNLF